MQLCVGVWVVGGKIFFVMLQEVANRLFLHPDPLVEYLDQLPFVERYAYIACFRSSNRSLTTYSYDRRVRCGFVKRFGSVTSKRKGRIPASHSTE